MVTHFGIRLFVITGLAGFFIGGCEKSKPVDRSSPAPPKAASSPPIIPPASSAPPISSPASSASHLVLTGITMKVPKGWTTQPLPLGPMSPRAVFRLPKAQNDEQDGMVRVTYFPGMKGKDELNIDRWLGQVTKPDGSSITRDDTKISITENNNIRLTVVDVSGTVRITMRSTAKPNSRMIAAIVDHPQGPHFVVAAGGVNTMKKWQDEIYTFLHSAALK